MKKPKKKQSITYTYWHWDEESKNTLPITITAGQDGVTEEHIIMLNDFDHAATVYDKDDVRFTFRDGTEIQA